MGFAVADHVPDQGRYAEAFAAGAVLTMLADSRCWGDAGLPTSIVRI
jgi:hypothetical protein